MGLTRIERFLMLNPLAQCFRVVFYCLCAWRGLKIAALKMAARLVRAKMAHSIASHQPNSEGLALKLRVAMYIGAAARHFFCTSQAQIRGWNCAAFDTSLPGIFCCLAAPCSCCGGAAFWARNRAQILGAELRPDSGHKIVPRIWAQNRAQILGAKSCPNSGRKILPTFWS